MEPGRTRAAPLRLLLTRLAVCALCVWRSSAIVIRAEAEVIVENGTTGTLYCSFTSNQVVSSATSVTWSFQSSQPDNQFSKDSHTILYFANGKAFPGQAEFKERLHFIGDINKRDVSIRLSPVQFSDNGTYFCDVKNPPDVEGTRARTELRVVLPEAFPQKNTGMIVGVILGALVFLVLIAVAACVAVRVVRNRHNYEGCTSLDSGSSSQASQRPRKKVDSSAEVSRCGSPSGPLQVGAVNGGATTNTDTSVGPVIYAQLDHSGSKHAHVHKMEPVVYADIRKN
uniref:Myelin protein zero-like 1 like n=1 Tax=Neogobius melanostomus TaxID=47308 RepID=A0A8C6TBU7_9GOBI